MYGGIGGRHLNHVYLIGGVFFDLRKSAILHF